MTLKGQIQFFLDSEDLHKEATLGHVVLLGTNRKSYRDSPTYMYMYCIVGFNLDWLLKVKFKAMQISKIYIL